MIRIEPRLRRTGTDSMASFKTHIDWWRQSPCLFIVELAVDVRTVWGGRRLVLRVGREVAA